MNTIPILVQYEELPEKYKKEANDFIEFLNSKAKKSQKQKSIQKRNGFGSLKGKIFISDDFDAPLEEFKDYL